MSKKQEMPSVLAFERKLSPSDGRMFGTTWKDRKKRPLKLKEKSVRGTISNRLKKEDGEDPAKIDADIQKPNLQTVDHCFLDRSQDTLNVHYTLKVLSGVEYPSSCNKEEFRKSYEKTVKSYIERCGFEELAKRYAINIANARFLWRNRIGAEELEVRVKILCDGGKKEDPKEYRFNNAYKIPFRDFDSSDKDLISLAEKIAKALSGKTPFLLLDVNAFSKLGNAQEVYPSEELVLDKKKGKGEKSKILYQVEEQAALHSQKIGNALRTIDTWYPEFANKNIGPISIEPYGSVTSRGMAYRNPKDKKDFYTLFDKYAWEGVEALKKEGNEDQEDYIMATLVRGGVFGKKSD